MMPRLGTVPVYYLAWVLAALAGIACGYRLSRAAGYPRGRSLLALSGAALAILLGSKLLYLLEEQIVPLGGPLAASAVASALRHGFRIPGGILLLVPAMPLLCRGLGLPTLRFVDTTAPAVGLALFCIRLGCFANGCCFGGVSHLPWAMSFPLGSMAYDWHISQGLIHWPAVRSLPVQPLQLYFAAVGLALWGLAHRWQRGKRYDGEVWVKSFLLFFGTTFVLEFLRGYALPLNQAVTAAVTVLTAGVAVAARRRGAPAPVGAATH